MKDSSILRNLSVDQLIKKALGNKEVIRSQSGTLVVYTGKYTGRSPNDKFIVDSPTIHEKINWGKVNVPISESNYNNLYKKTSEFFSTQKEIYVVDCKVGASKKHSIKLRVYCQYAYEAIFATHLFRRPDKKELKNLIAGIDDLPTLPTIATSILGLLDDPTASASELGKLISSDQGITLRILRMANSAYYGFPRQIGTVNLAIVVLGFDTVKNLTLSLSIRDTIKNWSVSVPFDFNLYWKHSLYTASGARAFAKNSSYKVPGEAFVAGLVHDMGKIIIAKYFPKEYNQVYQITQDENKSSFEAEEEIIGADHAQIGGWLAEKWNLPASIAESVTCHHAPAKSTIDLPLSSIINIANSYSVYAQLGLGAEVGPSGYNSFAWNTLKMRLKPDGSLDIEYYHDIFKNEIEHSNSLLEVLA